MSAFLKNLPVKIHVLGGRCLSVCLRPPTPSPPFVTHYMNTYGTPVLIHTGKGGRSGRWTSEKGRGVLVHKRGRKYQHDWLYLQSIKLYLTPVKTTIRIWCLYRYLVHGNITKLRTKLMVLFHREVCESCVHEWRGKLGWCRCCM